LTPAQLYSTASYQAHDLSGIDLSANDLTGWNLAGQNLTDASFYGATMAGVNLAGADVRGADFARGSNTLNGITAAQLYFTASYQAHDLTGIGFRAANLTGWNLAGQNLTDADLSFAIMSGADLTGAIVRGALLTASITSAQLYSTASYQAHDLRGIDLSTRDLDGWNFAGQNLTGADFHGTIYGMTLRNIDFRQANLTNVDFSFSVLRNGSNLAGSDSRGAKGLTVDTSTILTNGIDPDGEIAGLDLVSGASLTIRDYDGDPTRALAPFGIQVRQHLVMDPTGRMNFIFDADVWDSVVSFDAGIPVTRGGALDLAFAPDVDIAGQFGRTYDLFDWSGVSPTGMFNLTSPYAWDLSHLYTTGEVTLQSVPEPTGIALLAIVAVTLLGKRIGRNLRQ
jgi:uncharacterized protein YjbI with pentapeptide repeats